MHQGAKLPDAGDILDRHDFRIRLDGERRFGLRGEHKCGRYANHNDEHEAYEAHPDRLFLQTLPALIALAEPIREKIVGKQVIMLRSGLTVRGAGIAKVTSRTGKCAAGSVLRRRGHRT